MNSPECSLSPAKAKLGVEMRNENRFAIGKIIFFYTLSGKRMRTIHRRDAE